MISFLDSIARSNVKLQYIRFAYLPHLAVGALDHVLRLFPSLVYLSLAVDYVTTTILQPETYDPSTLPLGLAVLELTNSGHGADFDDKMSGLDVLTSIEEGVLSNLRQLRLARSLRWTDSPELRDEIDLLDEPLRAGTYCQPDHPPFLHCHSVKRISQHQNLKPGVVLTGG